MNLKQIERLEETLKAELKDDLEAIRRVKKLLRERGINGVGRSKKSDPLLDAIMGEKPPVRSGRDTDTGQHNLFAESTVESKVLEAISNMNGQFGLSDLKHKLNELFPNAEINRNTLSGIVFRQKDKAFRVISPGQGRRGAVYEKI